MFSSPSVRIYLSENAENHVQKKQVPHHLSRKPFIDRSVNGNSFSDKKLKPKVTIKNDAMVKHKISPKATLPQFSPESDLDGEDFIFSDKSFEGPNNVWPPLRLGKEGFIKILRDYSFSKNSPSPPPIGSDFEYQKTDSVIDSDFFELLPTEICRIQEPMLFDESFDEALPELQTFEDLHTSF